MTQIVLNPEQLSQTASLLNNAAGEYQAIGAQVRGCDCGCMPADVSAVVDSATALARSVLQGFSSTLAEQASDLSQRASISQEDGFGAVSAAWGGPASGAGTAVIGSSYDASGSDLIGGETFTIGGGGGSTDLIGGGTFSIGADGGSTDTIGGGTFSIGGGGGSTDTIEGGTFSIGGDGGSSDLIGGGTFTIGGAGGSSDVIGSNSFTIGGDGGSTGMVGGGTFTIDSSGPNLSDAIVNMAGYSGDMSQGILAQADALEFSGTLDPYEMQQLDWNSSVLEASLMPGVPDRVTDPEGFQMATGIDPYGWA